MGVGGWQLGSDRDPFPRDTQAKARGELNPRGTHGEHWRGAEAARGCCPMAGLVMETPRGTPRAHTSGFGSQQEPAAGNNWVLEV